MKLTIANTNDANDICNLLNLAYRGDYGWTTEKHLVSGNRTTSSDIETIINTHNTSFLTYKTNNRLTACICIEKKSNHVYIGSFAVHPEHQSAGLGSTILTLAEKHAISKFNPEMLIMLVLSSRNELISFYERRGYTYSGNTQPFPLHLNVGTPLDSDIRLVELTRKL